MAVVNDIYRLAQYCWSPPQQSVNVSYWQCVASVGTTPTDVEIADAFMQHFKGSFGSWMHPGASYLGCEVQKVVPTPVGGLAQSTLTAQSGTLTGDALPLQTAGVLSIRTALAGQHYRGRQYMPFSSEQICGDLGQITDPGLAILSTLATKFMDVVIAGTVGVAAVNFRLGVFRRDILTWQQATQVLVRKQFGTIRRRSRIGRNDTPIK